MMNEKEVRWNEFVEKICYQETLYLNEVQKNAVLVFWYDAQVSSAGHGEYFSGYPDVPPEEMITALEEVGGRKFVHNYKCAIMEGEKDNYAQADSVFHEFYPSLSQCLWNYVEENKDLIFGESKIEGRDICPICKGDMKEGFVRATDMGSLLDTLTMMCFTPKEEQGKLIRKNVVNLSLRGDGYYCERCGKVFATFEQQ